MVLLPHVAKVSGGCRNRWWGDVVEWPPATSRAAEGRERGEVWGGGIPLPTEGGAWGGAVPPPQKLFSILDLKMASFCALWVLIFTVRLLV